MLESFFRLTSKKAIHQAKDMRGILEAGIKLMLMGGLAAVLLTACSSTRNFTPATKYSPAQLRRDLDVVWESYRQNHPSIDWYTPYDSVEARFARVRGSFTDSLTESEFRARLAYAIEAIKCGHTSVMASKAYRKYTDTAKLPMFPLAVKVWQLDSMVVLQNLLGDTLPIRRGTMIHSINGVPVRTLIGQMMQYASTDGYSDGFKEIQIGAGFGPRLQWLYGPIARFTFGYTDSAGRYDTLTLPNWMPGKRKDSLPPVKKPTDLAQKSIKKEHAKRYGKLTLDTANSMALMQLNTFTSNGLPSFIRRTFRTLKREQIQHLVIDLRGNGGGKINNSTLLTRYISDKPFKIADSVSAKSLKLAYPRYTEASWIYKYFRWTFVKKEADGRYHMRPPERKYFQPKRRYHFDGKVYAITGGATFSASNLFLARVAGQKNVTVVGEETGGGARGNSAVMTPRITLPHTKVRVRLPLFRLITDANLPHLGRGLQPDVPVPPNSFFLRNDRDPKMETIMRMIKEGQPL